MPLPRVRFTTRQMMIAVALAALVLYADILRRRHVKYELRASLNAAYARKFRDALEKRSLNVFAFEHGPEFAATPALRLKWAEYHENLARKYGRAASHPWETVTPDPLPPEIFPPSAYGNY